jgi:hypothetical protein
MNHLISAKPDQVHGYYSKELEPHDVLGDSQEFQGVQDDLYPLRNGKVFKGSYV